MNYCVYNINATLPVWSHSSFIRAGQVFFGLLIFLAFGLKAEAQTATITVNTPSACLGGTEPIITFTGSGGSPEYYFNYTLDNGFTQSTLTTPTASTGGVFTITVPTAVAGTYVYTLTSFTDANTYPITGQSVVVVVNPLPTPTITASGPTTFVCPGGRVTLSTSAPPPGGSYNYQWVRVSDLGNDTTVIADSTNFSILAAGGYRYAVRVTDNNGCVAVSDTIKVQQNPPPQNLYGAHNTTTEVACISYDPDILNFDPPNTAVSGGVRPYTYQWQSSTDGGASWNNISGETSNSYDPPELLTPGSFSYRVIISDACGEELPTTAKTVTINAAPAAPTVTSPVTYCQGTTAVALTATPTGGNTLLWYTVPTGGTVSTTAPTPSTAAVGSTTYYVSQETSLNCEGPRAAITVAVNALPTITLGANASVCRGVTTASIPYSATTGAPNEYGIDYDAAANAAGFADITNGTLGVSPRSLTVPAAAPAGTYNATLTVRNSTTGCVSNGYPITITVNARPVPTISGAASACVGSTGNVYTTEAGMSGYTWTVSTGGTITAGAGSNSITVSWTTTGAKTITINYTDANGCIATAVTSYAVTVNTNPTAAITGPTSFCAGGSMDLSASTSTPGSGSISGYQWNLAGTPIAGANSSTYTVTAAGSYTVTVTNSNNCSTTSAARNVTVNPLPSITPGANPSVCRGVTTASIPFSAATGSPNQYSIDYDVTANAAGFADITNGILGASPRSLTVPAAAPAGTYNATLTVRNSTTGCVSNGYPITITVNARPVPTITGAASACVGSTGNFYTTEAGMSAYTWSVSAGGTITAGAGTNSITVSWTTTGTKTISINYTNANGCNATTATTYSVTVNANPTVNAIAGTTSVCVGNTITLTNTTPGGVWSSGDPVIATVNSSGIVTGVSGGTVAISYAVTNGNGCTTTVSRTITVNAQPTITVPTPAAFCSGGSTTLTAGGASTYTWSPARGLSITTGSTVIATPEATTTYTITGTGANGCSNSTTVTVTVIQSPEGEMSSEPPVCHGNNSGAVTLSNYTGTILRWESSTNGGTTWTTISGTTSVPYSNLTQTTIYRAVLELNGCQNYSSIGIIPVNPLFVPTVTATPPIICLGQSAQLTASGYGQPPFPLEDFGNANPAGWSGNDANNNNEDDNTDWGESGCNKVFNGTTFCSNAPPNNGATTNKYMIVAGTTDENDNTASLITPPFSLVGTINPIFSYWTALNFSAGTTGRVDISTDGGVTWTNLHTYTGPTNVGNANNGWSQNSINLSAYIGQPNIMVRFHYTGTAGSSWAVDNVGIAATFQPVTYQWSPTTYLTPTNGQGQTVTTTPTAAGTFNYCVVATSAVGCSSPPVCVDVEVKPLPTCSISPASDVCPGASTTYSAPAIAGYTYNWTISGGGTISGSATGQTVTVIANNSCGTYTLTLVITLNGCSSAPCTQVVNVVDNTAPVAPAAPATQSFQCLADVPAPGTLTATDNCSGNITATGVDLQVANGCGYTITRTWTFIDACNNTTSVSQTINVLDNTAPVAPAAPATQSFQCLADVPAPGTLTATDNCSGNITATGVDVQVANGCGYTITRTWTFTDACNNTSSVSQAINVLDNTAPAAPAPPATQSFQCLAEVPAPGTLTATDNCSDNINATGVDVQVANGCGYTVTRTWTFTDACDNTTSVSQTINVLDNIPPIATCPPAQAFCVINSNNYTIPLITASDNCSSVLTITYQVTGATTRSGTGNNASGIFNVGVSTITWTVVDDCGNISTCTTSVTISPKPTPIIYHN